MTMNMKQWVADILASDKKKSLPVLSFPSIQKMGITVAELINSSDKQAEGMKIIADSCPTAASVSLMDLSLEAEALKVLEEGKDRNDILGFSTLMALENYKKGRLM